jgi:hypothetical protein
VKKKFLIPLVLTPIIAIPSIISIALVSSYHNQELKKEIKKTNAETIDPITSIIPIILAGGIPILAIIILIPIFMHLVKRKKDKSDPNSSIKKNKTSEKELNINKMNLSTPNASIIPSSPILTSVIETQEFDINIDDISIEPSVDKKPKSIFDLKNIFKAKEKEKENVLKIKPGNSKEVLEINKSGNKYSFETVLFKKASTLVEETMETIDNFIMDNLNIKQVKNYKSIINSIDSIDIEGKQTLTKGYNMCQKFSKSKNEDLSFLNKE